MNLLHFIVIVVLAIAGYASHGLLNLGPKQKPATGGTETPASVLTPKEDTEDEPKVARANKTYHISKVIGEDFPDEVTMLKGGQALIPEGVLDLEEGDKLIPISLEGETLKANVKKYGDEIVAEVALSLTDFEKLVKPVTQRRLLGLKKKPLVAEKQPAKDPNTAPKPVTLVKPVAPVQPSKPAIVRGVEVSDSQIKSLMGKSYKSVKILATNKLIAAEAGATEVIGKKEFQTGIITFKRDTLLGIRQLKAKALIFDGEVVKWVWASSNQEIR